MSDPMAIGGAGPTRTELLFRDALAAIRNFGDHTLDILELGTKRSDPDFPTHHKVWLPEARWTMADVAPGQDVDMVADAHALSGTFGVRFDAVIAVAVWEHLERPWVAAEEVAKVLRSGGWCYIATHQTFPLHGYPSDYFRFSREAMTVLFEDAGLDVVHTAYAYRCVIEPPPEVTRWNRASDVEAWLNVDLVARKP